MKHVGHLIAFAPGFFQRTGGRLFFATAAEGGRFPCGFRGSDGDLMEPWPKRVAHPQPSGLFHQDEERGLEGVFGVVPVGKHATADSQNHWSVPFHEHGKGQLGALAAFGGEAFEELAIAQIPDGAHAVERADPPIHVGGF